MKDRGLGLTEHAGAGEGRMTQAKSDRDARTAGNREEQLSRPQFFVPTQNSRRQFEYGFRPALEVSHLSDYF